MKKRIFSSVLSALLVAGMLAGCGGKTASSNTASNAESTASGSGVASSGFAAAMVTDVGGVNDESFNQSAWEGMKRLESELGVDVSFIESHKDADYAPNLEKKADETPDIIWGIGFLMKDAIREAAESNPDQMYALVDDSFEDGELPNVISVVFQAEQSSFLVGYAAARMTQTDHVGFIVGMESPTMDRFKFGYMAGVEYGAKELGKEIKIDTAVVEAFDDSAKGKAMAQKMFTDGADVIFHAAGQSGTGVIEAAKEMDKMAIGVDLDQNKMAPDHVITSALKNVGTAVFNVTERVMNGEELGGTTLHMGLAEGGVGIAESSDKHLSPEIMESVGAIEEKIINDEIVVPYTQEAYDTFVKAL